MFRTNHRRFRTLLQQVLRQTHNLLTPKLEQCLICRKTLSYNSQSYHSFGHRSDDSIQPPQVNTLCQSCWGLIPWIQRIQCSICGRYETCYDCDRREETYFVCNRSAVRYDSVMKQWLAQYKYRKNERLKPLFIEMINAAYENITRELIKYQRKIQYISCIPISEERLEERGFNQAEMLAKGLAERYDLPFIRLLSRERHTSKQSYKTRAERLSDLQGAFTIELKSFEQITELHTQNLQTQLKSPFIPNILLVDDVYTTGSTLNQCAKEIVSHFPVAVYGLTWAR